MFYVDSGFILNETNLSKILNEYTTLYLPKLKRYKNYYDGKQDILKKYYDDETKPCNRIIKNYCKNIVDNYLGYMVGTPISYKSDVDINEVQDVLNYNDISSTDKELLKNALIYGIAYEIHYIDKLKKQRFVIPDSMGCIPIFSNDLDEELKYLIRFYPVDRNDLNSGYYVEIYSETETATYKTNSGFSSFSFTGCTENVFSQIPVIMFRLNSDYTNIFDCIVTLQDAYNTLLSSEVDDFEAFCDAYLALYGVTVDESDLADMKRNRILVLGADSKAEYLNKNISDTQIENMLNNISESIEQIANCPDWNSKTFSSNSSIAIRYKLLGMENMAAGIETEMKKALQKRIEIISEFISLIDSEKTWRDIAIVFIRNLPINTVEVSQVVTQLRGLVSDETLLTQVPFVTDVAKEMTALKSEAYVKAEGDKANVDNNTIANINNTLSTKNNQQPYLK